MVLLMVLNGQIKTMIEKLNEEVLKLKGVSCVRDERPIGDFGLKTCTKTKRYSK